LTELAATDTHALIWYATGNHRKLGREALSFFRRADSGSAAVYVPVTVLVEVAEAVHYRALELPGSLAGWIEGLRHSASYIVHDLTAEVVLKSNDLYEIPEPGDRLIAATAVHLGVPLITRDPGIAVAAAVPLIW
jgi:PIN domain nuclease of toxin-antitoxin system